MPCALYRQAGGRSPCEVPALILRLHYCNLRSDFNGEQTGRFTPLGKLIDSDRLFEQLKNIPRGKQPDSIRLNIPRVIRVIYDIRNGRDAAHLADDIDPNLQDATLVISNIDWVLAEFVRLYHDVDADEAQRIVNGLGVRAVPAVQDFNGFLKILNPKLKASQYVLLLLYERGTDGASFSELETWVQPTMRANLRATLGRLVHDKPLGKNLCLAEDGRLALAVGDTPFQFRRDVTVAAASGE
jgi:hypothetical protein